MTLLPLASTDEPYIPAGFGHEAFHNTTTLHPVGLAVLIGLGIWTLVAPRRSAILPIVALATLVPTAQRIVILTLDFNFLRILVLTGLLRVLVMGEHDRFKLCTTDRLVIAWNVASFLAYVALRGTLGSVIYKAGGTVDIFGVYLLARFWVRSPEDLVRVVRTLAVLSVAVALLFLVENRTGRNPFAVLGGVAAETVVREGRLRCQGPYVHPILSGAYWAALLPLFLSRWAVQRDRLLTILGSGSAVMIVLLSASSTPLLGVMAVFLGLAMYQVRHNMKAIWYSVVAFLVLLHFARTRPVWQLLEMLSVVGGSTGDQRYHLVDATIRHFREWMLLGVESTAHWGFYLFDITNQYVLEAQTGGLASLVLYILVLRSAFGAIGRTWRRTGKSAWRRHLAWGIGVFLFCYCCMFMAISINHAPQNLSSLMIFMAGAVALDLHSKAEALAPAAVAAARARPRGRARPKRLRRETATA